MGLCEVGTESVVCGGEMGDVAKPNTVDLIEGFGPEDTLPDPLDLWVAARMAAGNPCAGSCPSSLIFHEAFLYSNQESMEDPQGDTTTLITELLHAHITLHMVDNDGALAWKVDVALDGNGAETGLHYAPLYGAKSLVFDSLESDQKVALQNDLEAAFETQGYGLPENGNPLLEMRHLGCVPHHIVFSEIYPITGERVHMVYSLEWELLSLTWTNSSDE